MASEYGDRNAAQPENQSASLNGDFGTGMAEADVPRLLGYSEVTFDTLIQMHLLDCDQCRKAALGRPVGLGQKSGYCDAYWHLQLLKADEEGRVNNIVRFTEYGDEARHGRDLEGQ